MSQAKNSQKQKPITITLNIFTPGREHCACGGPVNSSEGIRESEHSQPHDCVSATAQVAEPQPPVSANTTQEANPITEASITRNKSCSMSSESLVAIIEQLKKEMQLSPKSEAELDAFGLASEPEHLLRLMAVTLQCRDNLRTLLLELAESSN